MEHLLQRPRRGEVTTKGIRPRVDHLRRVDDEELVVLGAQTRAEAQQKHECERSGKEEKHETATHRLHVDLATLLLQLRSTAAALGHRDDDSSCLGGFVYVCGISFGSVCTEKRDDVW